MAFAFQTHPSFDLDLRKALLSLSHQATFLEDRSCKHIHLGGDEEFCVQFEDDAFQTWQKKMDLMEWEDMAMDADEPFEKEKPRLPFARTLPSFENRPSSVPLLILL